MKEQFYPKWFKNEKALEQKKQLKNLYLLSLVFIFISLMNIHNGLKEIEEYKKSISNTTTAFHIEEKNFKSVDKFNYIYDTLNDKNEFIKGLNILKDVIYLEVYAKGIKEYGEMIKILEEGFIIEEISPLISEEGKGYFKVRMKNYELT